MLFSMSSNYVVARACVACVVPAFDAGAPSVNSNRCNSMIKRIPLAMFYSTLDMVVQFTYDDDFVSM